MVCELNDVACVPADKLVAVFLGRDKGEAACALFIDRVGQRAAEQALVIGEENRAFAVRSRAVYGVFVLDVVCSVVAVGDLKIGNGKPVLFLLFFLAAGALTGLSNLHEELVYLGDCPA